LNNNYWQAYVTISYYFFLSVTSVISALQSVLPVCRPTWVHDQWRTRLAAVNVLSWIIDEMRWDRRWDHLLLSAVTAAAAAAAVLVGIIAWLMPCRHSSHRRPHIGHSPLPWPGDASDRLNPSVSSSRLFDECWSTTSDLIVITSYYQSQTAIHFKSSSMTLWSYCRTQNVLTLSTFLLVPRRSYSNMSISFSR